VSEKSVGRFEKAKQEDVDLGALGWAERMHASGEVIQYQTTMFAKSRAVRQLRKGWIPAHPTRYVSEDGIGEPEHLNHNST